ncbi:hypothetical protein GN956_G1970 [Arapaima gigas]
MFLLSSGQCSPNTPSSLPPSQHRSLTDPSPPSNMPAELLGLISQILPGTKYQYNSDLVDSANWQKQLFHSGLSQGREHHPCHLVLVWESTM